MVLNERVDMTTFWSGLWFASGVYEANLRCSTTGLCAIHSQLFSERAPTTAFPHHFAELCPKMEGDPSNARQFRKILSIVIHIEYTAGIQK